MIKKASLTPIAADGPEMDLKWTPEIKNVFDGSADYQGLIELTR